MRIRTAFANDAAAIARVHVDSWLTTYSGLVSEKYLQSLSVERRKLMWDSILEQLPPDQTLIVAETEEQGIVGFLHAGNSREPEMGYDYEIYAVYLSAEVQGRGLGRKLFGRMEAEMRARGAHRCIYGCSKGIRPLPFTRRWAPGHAIRRRFSLETTGIPRLGWYGIRWARSAMKPLPKLPRLNPPACSRTSARLLRSWRA